MKKSSNSHIVMPFFCLMMIGLVFAAFYFLSVEFGSAADSQPENAVVSSSLSENGADIKDAKNDMALEDKFFMEKAIFVGDSRIHGLSSYGYIPEEKVYALDGSNQSTILKSEFVDLNGDGILYSLTDALSVTTVVG